MEEIRNASKTLNSGDIFMLNYSGHGGQVPDLQDDEPDGLDETWCLYNGQLVDDEHYLLLGEFAKGIRILSFSDSCHSGTMLKMAFYRDKVNLEISNEGSPKFRCMPKNIENRTYRDNKDFYDKILNNPKLKNSEERVKASALLISGCQDNQLSEDGTFNGLFTSQVLRVWKNGLFKGDYRKFYKTIVNRMPRDQTPNYYRVGTRNTRFERQRPFTV
jgi:hypothetical protein